jgi:hypothetical protein
MQCYLVFLAFFTVVNDVAYLIWRERGIPRQKTLAHVTRGLQLLLS